VYLVNIMFMDKVIWDVYTSRCTSMNYVLVFTKNKY